MSWKWNWRVVAVAAIAVGAAAGLGVGVSGYAGSHQSGPPAATARGQDVGTAASVGPALVLAQTGDQVTIRVLNIGAQESTETMQSFTDTRVPLNSAGG